MYGIYRPGEGYWTRVMTAIAAGVLACIGGSWLWDILRTTKLFGLDPVYVGAGGATLLVGICAALIYWLVGVKPASVDFLVATEVEMKGVTWSSKREIFGSTWVVLFLVAVITFFVFFFDIAFSYAFAKMGVLDVAA